jgi:hypothetical protein
LYAVPTLHFVKEALPLQGEQDGSLVREKKVLPDLVCRLIMQQLRLACHPAPSLPWRLCGETSELAAVFPEAVSCLTETRFLFLGTLASSDGHGLLPRKRNAPAVIQFCGRSFVTNFNFHKNDSKR